MTIKHNEGKFMRTVVITGSAKGFGLEMAKVFKRNDFNVVLNDINQEALGKALETLENIKSRSKAITVVCDVTKYADVEELWRDAKVAFGTVDIWINNAGVNQPDKPVMELTQNDIDFLLNVDIKGTIYGSKVAFAGMRLQGHGQIFNVEGYGSNDAMKTGLTVYGTAKRAVTYFTQALAKESVDISGGRVHVGRLTPGIMITDFIVSANGGATKIELSPETKKVYNILGDYPSTIAEYVVPKMIKNEKNNVQIAWLTNLRAFGKFIKACFVKKNYFGNTVETKKSNSDENQN